MNTTSRNNKQLDEGLLLNMLRHGQSSNPTHDVVDPKENNPFTNEIQNFDKDTAAAIQELEQWMASQNGLVGPDDPPVTNYNDIDDASITSWDVNSLCEELRRLDDMMRNDPESLSRELGLLSFACQSTETCAAPPRRLPKVMTWDTSLLSDAHVRMLLGLDESNEQTNNTKDGNALENHLSDTNDDDHHHHHKDIVTSPSMIQYTGPVGYRSRSIRTQQPMPRPHYITEQQVQDLQRKAKKKKFWKRWLYKLKRISSNTSKSRKGNNNNNNDNNNSSSNKSSSVTWIPFVEPFVTDDGSLCMTPRLISYYEVEIMDVALVWTSKTAQDLASDEITAATTSMDSLATDSIRSNMGECIAIGMSTQDFDATQGLPGWDAHSFGYHGDDGSHYYNRNPEECTRRRPFGKDGDVVGCGIDYRTGQVFYTLNGKFLGYSLTLNQDQLTTMDWYPTLGLDSHSGVSCNFGSDRPFCYDLETMIEIGKQV